MTSPPPGEAPRDDLLSPTEAAEILGINKTTLLRRVPASYRISGRNRVYLRSYIYRVRDELAAAKAAKQLIEKQRHQQQQQRRDARQRSDMEIARLYDQGASIRAIAAQLNIAYGTAHRALKRQRTTLRSRGGYNPSGD